MSEETKKVTIPAEDMKRINESMKKLELVGVPKKEIDKYFYECVQSRMKE